MSGFDSFYFVLFFRIRICAKLRHFLHLKTPLDSTARTYCHFDNQTSNPNPKKKRIQLHTYIKYSIYINFKVIMNTYYIRLHIYAHTYIHTCIHTHVHFLTSTTTYNNKDPPSSYTTYLAVFPPPRWRCRGN